MKGYGQVCPIARAAEVIGERWNLLILRALFYGAQNFNSLRKSMSAISPTLLSKRLKSLEQAQVIERTDADGSITYRLTDAGWALRPSVEALGAWASEYTPSAAAAFVDVGHILWEMHHRVDTSAFSASGSAPASGPTVFRFRVEGAQFPEFHLVVADGVSKIVFKLPERMAPALTIECSQETLAKLWIAEQTFDAARRAGDLLVEGDEACYDMLKRGLQLNLFATIRT